MESCQVPPQLLRRQEAKSLARQSLQRMAPENGDGNKPKRRSIHGAYSIDPDLNLHGGGNVKSFEKFVAEKKPSSNAEFNTVANSLLHHKGSQPAAGDFKASLDLLQRR
ncbi:MAG: hypothetical protein U1F83_18240 [Verrucomicrobiota bacterium]